MMLSKIKQRIKNQFSQKPISNACRDVTVLPDDVFLVSYPKSGNTWLRFIIANLIHIDHTTVSFSNIEKLVPDIYKNCDRDLLQLATPRILKSHECFDYRYQKVIYVVRDPRDVAVSYYYYLIKIKKIEEDYPIDLWIKPFIEGKFMPKFGSWSKNVESWLSARDNKNLLLIKYEDMESNTYKEVSKIASFLNLTASNKYILKSIELSSAQNMRQSEKQTKWQPNQDSRKDIPFIRKAKSGNWKTDLSEYAIKEIETNWEQLMKKLKYLD